MEKALEMGKTSAVGSFHLFIGVAASTIIMAVGTVVLAWFISPEEYGLYTIALVPSLMIVLFRDWGINSAITRYIAYLRAENKTEDIRSIITVGIIFEAVIGLTLSLISFFLAGFIASTVFNRPESASLISIVSVTIFSGALLTAAQSSFVGFERMELYSFTSICQAIIKTVISPLLVFFGYSALGAVLGYTASFLAASIIGLIILYVILFRKIEKTDSRKLEFSNALKMMLRYGVPLSISAILSGFMIQFYSFMLPIFCTDTMIGNYQIAAQFAVLLTFFTFPISTVLFPVFAKLESKNDSQLLQTVFSSSTRYSAMLLVPATMVMIVLSRPMIGTLFGEKWIYAPFFLSLYVVNNLFILLGNITLSSFLAGLGETRLLMKLGILTLALGVPLAFVLIPAFGVVGAILGLLVAGVPSLLFSLYWTWKNYKVKVDFKSSARIFVASATAALVAYLSVCFLGIAEWARLIIGGTVFLAFYLIIAPAIGAVTQMDIDNLRAMLSGLGFISKLINIPLTIVERILRFHYF